MLVMAGIMLGIGFVLFAMLPLVISSAYAAYKSMMRTRVTEHLSHYHLQLLEDNLQRNS
jgi:hypothetical protein